MLTTVLICAATCLLMLGGVLFLPRLRLGKITVSTYWLAALLGAVVLLACGCVDLTSLGRSLVADTAVNPLKILALFLAMTMLSVFLDEVGFFRYLANVALHRAKSSRKKLFFILYFVVSVLTVFTSNDVIILSFTPFLCYFCKHADIDPIPYLVAEFVAANTWSMALVIGNPTNIYLATCFGIGFVDYLKYSLLPTLFAGLIALPVLYLLFRKSLSLPMEGEAEDVHPEDKPQLIAGIVVLGSCTLLLAVGPSFGAPMWIVAVSAAGGLFLFSLIYCAAKRKKPKAVLGCLKRAPWQLIPFMLSMYVLVSALDGQGVTAELARLLDGAPPVIAYGVSSFLVSNLINNIPMSELFASVLSASGGSVPAVMATIVGSNLGALLTPVGALAGLMFGAISERYGAKLGFGKFVKYGAAVSVPALAAALSALALLVAI